MQGRESSQVKRGAKILGGRLRPPPKAERDYLGRGGYLSSRGLQSKVWGVGGLGGLRPAGTSRTESQQSPSPPTTQKKLH